MDGRSGREGVTPALCEVKGSKCGWCLLRMAWLGLPLLSVIHPSPVAGRATGTCWSPCCLRDRTLVVTVKKQKQSAASDVRPGW